MAKDRFGDIAVAETPPDTVGRFDTVAVDEPEQLDRFGGIGVPQTVIDGSQDLISAMPEESRLLADEIFALTADPNSTKTDLINTSYFSDKLRMRFDNAFDLKEMIGTQLFGIEDPTRDQLLHGIQQMEIERYRQPAFEAAEEPGFFSRIWHSIRDKIVTPRDIEGRISRGPFMALLLGKEEFPDLEQLHRKTFKQTVKDAYEQSGNRMVKSLAGRTQLIGDIGTKLSDLLNSNTPEARQLKNDLTEWGEYMAMASDIWYAENPEAQLQIQPGTGFLGTTAQYILHPENILQGTLETVPMLLTAVLGHITGTTIAAKVGFGTKFLPWAGRVAGIAEPEIGEEYANARAQGLDVENALAQSYTKAYTRAVIEEWVLGEKVKIFKGAFGRAASSGFAKKTTDLLLGGKRAYIRGALEEGTQSITDRFWEMVFGNSEDWFEGGFAGLIDRLTEGASEAAAVGGLLELGLAGVFRVSGQVVASAGRVDVRGQVRRINQIRQDIKQNRTLDEQSKEEIDNVLDEKVEQVEAEAPEVAPEAAAAPPVEEVSAEVIEISPEEARAELEALSYKELQQQAKELGIKANQKKAALVEQIVQTRPAAEVVEEEKGEFDFVYHTSFPKNLESITESGLQPEGKRPVFFAQSIKGGLGFGNEGDPLFRVAKSDIPQLEEADEVGISLKSKKAIPPDLIEVSFDKGKTWQPIAPAAPERVAELVPREGETKEAFRARVREAKGIKPAKLPPSKPTKAEQMVIDAKKFNKQIAEHQAAVKGEAGIIETEGVDEIDEPLGRTMPPEWYENNAKVYKKTILEKSSDFIVKRFKELDFLLGGTTTRLRNISPELGRRLHRHEFNVLTRTTEQMKRIEPFIEKTTKRKLGKIDFNEFDLAYKNSDGKKMRELAVKHGFTKELAEFRRVNNELFHQGNAVGLEIDYLVNHFHRSVKDTKGLLEYFQGRDDWSIVRTAIEKKESQRGRALTQTERAAVVNTLLRGYRTSALGLTAPGAAKARTVQEVTAEINQFYHSPRESMVNYIETMNEKIAAREFFGRQSKEITKLRGQQSAIRTRLGKLSRRQGRQKAEDVDKEIRIGFVTTTLTDHISRAKDKFDEITEKLDRMGADDLSNTIGQYVIELVNAEEIKPSQEKEVRDLLMARFDPKGTSGIIGEIIPLTYIDVLSQITSTLTQLEELALAFYRSPVGFVPAATKAILNLSEITLEDIGITTISQELTDVDSRRMLATLLSITQFKRFDAFAKQVFINTALKQLQQQSRKEGMTFNDRLKRVFGEETEQVVKDLKSGEITEDVKLLIFSQLLDIQPLAKSEVPEAYNRAGNLRIFYQLKTFMTKQLDFVRTEALQDMRNPKADPTRFMRGFGRLMWLTFSLVLFGAGRDMLVDFVTGRPFNLKDSVIDTILRRIFFSRFQYTKALREGFGRAFLEGFVPATKTVDAVSKDISKVSRDDTDGLDVWRSVPIVGEFYYWWFGRGREKAIKEQRKARRETVRRKPLFTGTKD